ncbi:MAG: PAS domain S-box protein [Candidatus Heimdallarchaeota archaeon]|nr:PAS domain S-box protein [Candidatus Heimdallarchaeota archaeon]
MNNNSKADESVKKELNKADEEIKTLKKKLKESRNELKSLKTRFDSLFEMTNDAIFWAEFETEKFILVNKQAVKLFGYDLEEIYKMQALDFVAPEERKDCRKKTKELLKRNTIPIYERVFMRKDGRRISCEVNLSLINDPVTNKTIIQSIIRDISERKKYEQSLERDKATSEILAKAAINEQHIGNLCQNVLEGLVKVFAFNYGFFRFYDYKQEILLRISEFESGKLPNKSPDIIQFNDSQYVSSIVANNKKPIISSNIKFLDINDDAKKNLEKQKINSLISWPILNSNQKLLGIFQLSSLEIKKFSEDEIIYFESLAKFLATAIERILAEEALLMAYNERKELDRIIFLSPAIVFLWVNAPGWPVEFVSENIAIFGYSSDDFYSGYVQFSNIIHPEDLERVAKEVQEFSEDKKRMEFIQEYRIITKSGEIRWIVDYTTIRRDLKRNITHFHGIILDNTETKKAVSSLKNERRAFQIIAEAVAKSTSVSELCELILDDLIEILGFDVGVIRLYDNNSRMLIPFASKKTISQSSIPFTTHSIDNPTFINSLVARTKKAIFAPDVSKLNLDNNILSHLKERKLNSVITWPILKVNNELLGVLQLASRKAKEIPQEDKILFKTLAGTLANVIERKIAEEELKKLNEELELRVQERTKQLGEVIKELESFSYTISHDLRSPLRSIAGFSDALQEDYSDFLDTTGKDYLNRIKLAAKKMSNLIDEILSLSRLTSVELNFKEVNISEIAKQIIAEYKKQEPTRDIDITIEENMIVKGDPTLINTIMENLLGNSWKFTSKTPKARINFGKKILNNQEVFFVQDNGIGFNMAYGEKLFTIFQRLHSDNEFEGTGVGLAIVQRIIQRHNGRIWGEGKEGKGATFYFTLI